MTRTEFLREQTLSGANKCRRTPIPPMSTAEEPFSLTERKALTLKKVFDTMPVYIGPKELIVGTRTFFSPNPGNEDGHDVFAYGLCPRISYVNEKDIEYFGFDKSYSNKTHFTPDFSIILQKGIDGILVEAEQHKTNPAMHAENIAFLSGVIIAYTGLQNLILRYAKEADDLAETAPEENKEELLEISRICKKISTDPPETFYEALQLLWFTHLGTIIESFEFINYGRLDVILGKYLKDTPREKALQLVECLLLKMYDQADLITSYLGKYAAQLVVTLGGVLPDGNDAVNDVIMLFLDAIDTVRLPEPEFNMRLNSKNPPEFLDKAAKLSISGCNFISYYNDDLFVESLHHAGIPIEYARDYGFDLCQDINIPGKGDFYTIGTVSLTPFLMRFLEHNRDFDSFSAFIETLKTDLGKEIYDIVQSYNADEEHLAVYAEGRFAEYIDGIKYHGKSVTRRCFSPMAPLPFLSVLYHGSLEKAQDIAYEPYPVKAKGLMLGTATEAINSLAAIKKIVFDEKSFSLDEIYSACVNNFSGDRGKYIQTVLWNCPKWGNDDDYVDSIAKDLLEYCLQECTKYKTFFSGQVLGGIHQPHPVFVGADIMATPEGRNAGAPVAVTLTPENGTMRNGPTAVLHSASKLDPMLIQWNFCVMVNYFASVFQGNDGVQNFKTLLNAYFKAGGLQHQPNITDVESLRKAQAEPEKYKDLIVRLWGVSAHFVDLPKELQNEMIARYV